jgi:hypothetical protein
MRLLLLPIVVGLLLLSLLALFSVPARVVPMLIGSDQLRLSGLSGRAVDGRAARAMLQTPGGFFHLGELRWRLDPWSLLRLSPALEIESEWVRQRASLRLHLSGSELTLRDLDASVDASIVRQALPVSVRGRLEMLFDELVIAGPEVLSIRGRLVWRDAGWESAGGLRALGSYVALFSSPAEGDVRGRLETLSGNVSVEGSAALLGRRYTTDLRVTAARGSLDPELEQALSLVATPTENGYRLRLDGELAPPPAGREAR